MTVFNLGSINIDNVYALDRLPKPGETLPAKDFNRGLGGKGANQSIAIARAGGQVHHIGAIGDQSEWTVQALFEAGVDTGNIATVQTPTGHAVIFVDQMAENSIVLLPGANMQITTEQINSALSAAEPGDWFLLQNETNLGSVAAKIAQEMGMRVCYSAAPFSVRAVTEILPFTSLLVVNEIEFQQLKSELSYADRALSRIKLIVTYGAKGATYFNRGEKIEMAAYPSDAVDTTGAGDTFLGYALSALDQGEPVVDAMNQAAAAAAIQVSRPGAAAAIPKFSEVQNFLKGQT